ncbi:DUF6785 family protein [Maridesulfovibrio ferrireducens]|uniref:DUF6785 family protein n=1 Tax=Maridesulfovibrio ferrireducens TaxID=246191 RepID=UPI001A27765F|nr:DUF6785 family protein [Maridesulfovibrio ferrireducens]MBI9110363.1 hypothetical protein [Maridesulfovibrio ferrireducens]
MHGNIRIRAIALGILFGLLICAFTPFNNAYLNATPLAGGHFPLAPFFILAWLTAISALHHKIFRSTPLLTGLELMTMWILTVVVSGIAFTGLARTFFINLTAPFHFASIGNRWKEILQPLLPDALHPTDPKAVETLYNGIKGGSFMSDGELISAIPWSAWVTPLLWWAAFILLCYFMMLCLTNIFSRQWVENERINFPLLQLPRFMEEALDQGLYGSFLTNKFFLCGLFFCVALHTLNGLHFYIPAVPEVPTLVLAGKYFAKTGLFSGFGKLKIYFYPAFVGFAFLASRQISFSFWFFFLTGGLFYGVLNVAGLNIPASSLGVTFGPTLTRPEETQMIGAYLVFFFFIVWLARQHLQQVLREAFGGKQTKGESEWMSLRFSFWGLIISGCLLVAWCVNFGVPMLMALLVLTVFFIFTVVASKAICQGGIAYFTLTAAPLDGVTAMFGTKFFGAVGIAITAMCQKILFVDLRESLMPSLVHGSKVNEWIKNKKLFLSGIIIVLLAGVAVSFAAMLFVCYKYGIRELHLDWATRTSMTVYDNVVRVIQEPAVASEWVTTFSTVGAVIMFTLVLAYNRLPWWPLHPIGYLTAYSSAMKILWFSFFLGWMFNQLTLRYGGVGLFKRIRYLFFGLIMGDFLMGGAWALYGLWAGQSYQVLPG